MANDKNNGKTMRIGALVAGSLLLLMVFLFFIGSEQKLFARKIEYEVRFESVSGLAEGNPVKLSGVTIGVVKDIRLPQDPSQRSVVIGLSVDRKFSERIRNDSRARLKKLGLLTGDSFVDISPGSPNQPVLAEGSLIPSQKQTNVDSLISSGEDLVDNFVQISYSLKNILGRVDRGEGLIGEITSQPQSKQRLTDTLLVTLNKTNNILQRVESGRGLVGKLVFDDAYSEQLTSSLSSSINSLQVVMTNLRRSFDTGEGIVPALLSDPVGKQKVVELVENLRLTSENLTKFSQGLKSGEGLVPRLVNDKKFADDTLREFNLLVKQLSDVARKLNEGEGTAGKLIADPAVYESINDILIGINESKMLRWLIRNRQEKGIETRYEDQEIPKPPSSPGAVDPKSRITPPGDTQPPKVPPVDPQGGGSAAASSSTQPPSME